METPRAKTLTSEARQIELLNAPEPQIPEDYAQRWGEREIKLFQTFRQGRADADWGAPEIRLLCQIVELEVNIMIAQEELSQNGSPIARGQHGQPITHPSVIVMNKLSVTQNTLMRRLGICIDGTVAPRDIKKNAKRSVELKSATPQSSHAARFLA